MLEDYVTARMIPVILVYLVVGVLPFKPPTQGFVMSGVLRLPSPGFVMSGMLQLPPQGSAMFGTLRLIQGLRNFGTFRLISIFGTLFLAGRHPCKIYKENF